MRKINEECGLFGIYDNDGFDVARLTYFALYALQHRGQESCGIAVNDDGHILSHKDAGLVPEVFNDVILDHLNGMMALGHVRYSTASEGLRTDAQPLVTKYVKGTLAVGYNGALVNASEEREKLEKNGAIFQTSTDAEIITYLLARNRIMSHSIEESVKTVVGQLKGGYSLLVMSPRKLIAARDPHGLRPLIIGKKENSYVVASETCALDAVGAQFLRDCLPGEIITIDKNGIKSDLTHSTQKGNICVFEYVYFARPDSVLENFSVYQARKQMGHALAEKYPVECDLVIGVPDSGTVAAIGYAERLGVPHGMGMVKNRYVGRTFIRPTQAEREQAVDIKLNAIKSDIEGKRIVMVDDSIVRGTTCGKIVKMLKNAGAKEVHIRISSPPFLYPCYFGTDVPSKEHLAAHKFTIDEMRRLYDADSLEYLPLSSLHDIFEDKLQFCHGCFSGNYPMEIGI